MQKRIRLRTSCRLVSRCKAVACCWLALLMLLTVEGPRWLMVWPFNQPLYNLHDVLPIVNDGPSHACAGRRLHASVRGSTVRCCGRPPHTARQLAWACKGKVPQVGTQHKL